MGDNLDGIFYINLAIMASVFVGAAILSMDIMWTRKGEAAKRSTIKKNALF